jgi:hypothetical protein
MDFFSLLIGAVLILVAVAVLLWIVGSAPFLDAEMKPIIRWVILALTACYILAVVFGYAPWPRVPLPR